MFWLVVTSVSHSLGKWTKCTEAFDILKWIQQQEQWLERRGFAHALCLLMREGRQREMCRQLGLSELWYLHLPLTGGSRKVGWSEKGLVCPNPAHFGDRHHSGHHPWAAAQELFPGKPNQVNADSSSPTGTFVLSLARAFRCCCSIPACTRETRARRAGMTKALISVTRFPRAVWLRWGEMRQLWMVLLRG